MARARTKPSTAAASRSRAKAPDTRGRSALDPHVAELLGATDAYVTGRTAWRSLAPGAGRPRSLVTLAETLLPATSDRPALHDQQAIAWAMAVSDLARAIAREFPENLFADLDHVAATLREVVTTRGHVALERTIDPLVRIHRAYGLRSRIRFRYVHDFLYGFDWARWVAREPDARSSVGPFDPAFLAHSEHRAVELDALVEADDPTYPRLAEGTFRNPFPFEREPDAERALFLALAAEDLLPIRAFDADARPSWERPFTALREEKARAMGLARRDPPTSRAARTRP